MVKNYSRSRFLGMLAEIHLMTTCDIYGINRYPHLLTPRLQYLHPLLLIRMVWTTRVVTAEERWPGDPYISSARLDHRWKTEKVNEKLQMGEAAGLRFMPIPLRWYDGSGEIRALIRDQTPLILGLTRHWLEVARRKTQPICHAYRLPDLHWKHEIRMYWTGIPHHFYPG